MKMKKIGNNMLMFKMKKLKKVIKI